jgi:hypothetical protein
MTLTSGISASVWLASFRRSDLRPRHAFGVDDIVLPPAILNRRAYRRG